MLEEVLQYLKPSTNQVILDMTFGAGGHSQRILESGENIKLLALDRDPNTQVHMKNLGITFPGQLTPFLAGRGFSLSKDGPLDMRMDGNRFPDLPTAAEILARANELDLARILKVYGEEKQAKKIARAIVEARYLFRNLNTTGELADLVDSVCNEQVRVDKLHRRAHNATKTFQALRIFVNNELNEINYGLILAHKYLKIGGRLVTISFHSLEDTIVKRHLMGNLIENIPNQLPLKYLNCGTIASKDILDKVMEANWKCLNKHVILPTDEEVESNPRSRSAKLRAAIKLK
ncbi:MraW methylase family [Popillia japonica]|uniref:MraW methylase family n=1 Tax=Popillia japonica TaxID=7064 RepID=A0AAW1L6Y8_POPJA